MATKTRARSGLRYGSALGLLLGLWWLLALLHEQALSAALFLRMEGGRGAPAWLVHYGERAVRESELTLRSGPARLYQPSPGAPVRGLVLAHGIHEGGIQEPRLVGLARALASRGLSVLTPQLTDLAQLRVTHAGAETIGDAARALSRRLGVPRVAVFGVSFGGGLALRAACEPRLGAHIDRVIALGAHHDVARVARGFLGEPALGPMGQQSEAKPHPYGLKVLFQSLLGEKQRGAATQEQLQRLRAELDARAPELNRASPAACQSRVKVPVFLVHGLADGIIPYTETLWNEQTFYDDTEVHVLISSAIAHAEYGPPSVWERLELVNFMAKATR